MKLSMMRALREGQDPAALLAALDEVGNRLKAVEDAMTAARAAGAQLPSLFRRHIHAGSVNNLDTPREYRLWVHIENLKDLYSLSKAVRETRAELAQTKAIVKGWGVK